MSFLHNTQELSGEGGSWVTSAKIKLNFPKLLYKFNLCDNLKIQMTDNEIKKIKNRYIKLTSEVFLVECVRFSFFHGRNMYINTSSYSLGLCTDFHSF